MRSETLAVTPFQQNCTLLWCEATGKTAIVDPGGELERITDLISRYDLTPQKILLTHGHIDHAGGAGALARQLDIPIEGPHEEDRFLLDALVQQAELFGFPQDELEPCHPDLWFKQGDRVEVGEEVLEVLHCPGHTPGHLVFYHQGNRLALVGDVLFRGSIGRTDFPRGNHADLLRSIRERLWPLGNEVIFIPGHGPNSTFGEERRSNPFVADNA